MKSKTALRQVLLMFQCLVLLLASFSFDVPAVQAASLSRGAVLGALTDTSVKVWVRTDAAGTFQIEYKTSGGSYPGTFSSITSTSSGDDYTNVVSLTGLTANTTYDYRVYVDSVLMVGTGSSGTFTTMKTSGSPCTYKFSLTGDLSYDQMPYTLMTNVAARLPLFSIFPGDQIYGPSSGTKSSLEAYYQDNWNDSPLRTFLKNIPGFFIWDDHELFDPPSGPGNDWDGGKAGDYNISRTVYEEYQNSVNPSPLVPGETYYSFTVCDTSFFVADSRSYRSPTSSTDSTNNDMFGSAQVAHMKSWLLNNTSTIKFLVSPSPWPDNVANGNDSFRGFDNERQEMYRFIKQNNIKNVFILSGDQHNEVLYRTDLSNVNKLYEFTATPVGSGVQTADASLGSGGSTKVCVNVTQSKFYGTIDVDTTVSPAQVTFKSYNGSDVVACNQTITLSNSGPATPTLVSAANQTFNVGAASTTMSTMTVTDAATATITAASDIRIRIPSTVDMIWDTSVATATIGGAASAKVSGTTVTFEDSSKTAVINVTSNFAAGDVVTIAGLKFKNFNAAVAKSNLGIDIANDGGADSTDTRTIEILPTSGAAVYSVKNHAFNVSQATQTIDTITVVDGSTPAITAANDIRVKIPSGFNMTWDATDTTATIGGSASAKVSTTVSYADSDKTLVLNTTSDFAAGDYITINGLSLKNFSGSSASTNFGIDTNNDSSSDATDAKAMKIEAATTKVWTGLGNDSLWSNNLNWSGQEVPAPGDAVVFDGTSTTDCVVDYAASNLYSITLDTLYTGTVRYTPYASQGSLGVLTLTGGLTVNGGTLLLEGDSHIDGDTSTPAVNDGTGYTITSPSITVGAGGTISANAEGFEQGVGPAHGAHSANTGGTGGSYGGVGGYPLNFGVSPSSPYGSATSPLSLGSGGGFDGSLSGTVPQNGAGGAGGGALKFNVSGTMSVSGTVSANGENASTGVNGNARYGGGSGGSIWISATTVSGSGSITANGGTTSGTDAASSHPGGDGGGGRISFGSSGYSFTGSVQVNGGAVATTYSSTGTAGHAGTVSFPSATLANFTVSNALTLGNDISYTFGNLTIASGGTLTFDSNPVAGTGATITATNITIDNGGVLTVSGKGYHSGDPNAPGLGTGNSVRGAGGGHGGRGGDTAAQYLGIGGPKYGSATAPVTLGSGGAKVSADGSGGGALKINLSGTMTVNGTFSADGNSAGSNAAERGAGAGGSLWINGGTLAGSGTIRANGGTAGTGGGAGGGGRIALDVTANTFSGLYQVSGGARSTTSHSGYAGTISFPSYTDLVVG
nr:alkaline phosphatase D family protein [Candidatus Paceibacterota bacterium]